MAEMIGGVVLAILVGLGLFLILRYFWLWYWKIDKMVDLLERIDENTRKPSTTTTKKVAKKIVEHECSNPKCENIFDMAIGLCPKCGTPTPK